MSWESNTDRGRASQEVETREEHERREPTPVLTDAEESEALEERITENSPEGRPEHSDIGGAGLLWMILLPVGAVAVLSLVVLSIWGMAAAGLVLVFGTALACLGNPEVWATFLRAKEREELEERADHERKFHSNP